MMRVLRALAFLAVGLLLGGVSVYAMAETTAPTNQSTRIDWNQWTTGRTGSTVYATAQAACTAAANTYTPPYTSPYPNNPTASGTCYGTAQNGSVYSITGYTGTATCPAGLTKSSFTGYILCTGLQCEPGQNWTLSGGQCTRPDCVAPEVRDPADGICKPPACPTGQTKTVNVFSGKWAVCGTQNAGCLTGTLSLPSSYCDGSCVYSMQGSFTGGTATGSPSVTNPVPVFIDMTGTSTGSQCSQATNVGAGTPPVIPQTPPPCAAGQGVLTTSTGTVACVPESTPGVPPKVTKSKTTESTPEGTWEREKTTTQDPVTNAKSVSESTTFTPVSGPPTTSNKRTDVPAKGDGSGEPSPDNSGDEPGQCAKEPDSPMCKKGTPKEKGQLPGIATAEAELAQAKSDLTAKFNEVKTAASQMFGTVGAAGGGSLPCPPPVVIMGKPISFCLTQYEGSLAMIGGGVMFIAAILSAFIILL